MIGNQCPQHLCFTFKQLAIQCDIHAMKDVDGNVQKDWDNIVEVMISHFIKLLGTEVPPEEAALQEFLEA